MHHSSNTPIADLNQSEISLLDLVLVLKINWRILVIIPIVTGILALGGSFLIKPKYSSTIQIMLPQQQQSGAAALLGSLGGLAGAAAGVSGIKNPADQWIGLLKSITVQDGLVNQFNLRKRYNVEYQFEARTVLENMTTIKSGKDSLISITVVDHDPKTAADMASAYVNGLQKLSKNLAVTEAAQRRLFFEDQLKEAKNNLIKAETTLRQSGVNESILKTSPDAAVGGISQLKAQIAATEIRVSVMRGQLTANSPDLQQVQLELASLRNQLRKAEQDDVKGGSTSGTEYVSRYREFKYYETLFEMMARQYELAKSDEARDGAIIQIVDPAQIPEWKSSPKRAFITVLMTILSLTLCFAFVLIRHVFRHAIANDSVFSEKLARLSRKANAQV
jgi:uncharacterized protein involved in exopolysaccharide biosynthesis